MTKGSPCIEDPRLLRDCPRSQAYSNQRRDGQKCGKEVEGPKEYTRTDGADVNVVQLFPPAIRHLDSFWLAIFDWPDTLSFQPYEASHHGLRISTTRQKCLSPQNAIISQAVGGMYLEILCLFNLLTVCLM